MVELVNGHGYKCKACGDWFVEQWGEEKAMDQLKKDFGDRAELTIIVCHRCYDHLTGLVGVMI